MNASQIIDDFWIITSNFKYVKPPCVIYEKTRKRVVNFTEWDLQNQVNKMIQSSHH